MKAHIIILDRAIFFRKLSTQADYSTNLLKELLGNPSKGKRYLWRIEGSSFWIFEPRPFSNGLPQRIFQGKIISDDERFVLQGKFQFTWLDRIWYTILSLILWGIVSAYLDVYWLSIVIALFPTVSSVLLGWLTTVKREQNVIEYLYACAQATPEVCGKDI